MLALYVKVPTM